ncbi:MAG TPA: hypothetical protein VNO52_14330 [Methylomirabilota bacterium]|nr:hypothetical protein [Methylomirabilota bacterium]
MSAPEHDFEALRRLLALKRHETPPPGYFRDFPDRVAARIAALQAAAPVSWLERFGLLLRPAAVCGCGVLMSALLTGALVASRAQERQRHSFLLASEFPAENGREPAPVPMNLADVPASVAPVLPGTSPFTQFIPSARRANFNVMLVGR